MSLVIAAGDLSRAAARTMAEAAGVEADRQGVAVSIVVVDRAGQMILFERMDGVHLGTIEVAMAKARCAALFRRPTSAFAKTVSANGSAALALPNVLPFPGGVPIDIDGQWVGAIGISGAAPDVDEQIALRAQQALAEQAGAGARPGTSE